MFSSMKYQCLILVFSVLSCQMLLPAVEAFGHKHQQNDNGLAVLLAAGLLAKLLRHKHEEHHVHIPVPVHHEHHEHHGSGSARVPVHHAAPVPMGAQVPMGPQVPMGAQVPMQASMPMVASVPMQHVYGGVMMGAPTQQLVRRVIYTPPPPQPMYPVQNSNSMPF